MRILFSFMILCACALASDDTTVTTTVKPHSTRLDQTTTREVFTRAGKTNLIRVTTARDGAVISRLHRFYYHRRLVADHMVRMLDFSEGSDLTTTAGFSLTFSFGTNSQILEAYVGDKDGNILDVFTGTNGVLFPMPAEELKKLRKSLATRGNGE